MPQKNNHLPQPLQRLLRVAIKINLCGLFLFACVVLWGLYTMVADGTEFDLALAENFLDGEQVGSFSIWQRIIGVVLLLLSVGSGVAGLFVSHRLFSGYLKGQVFDLAAAAKIRLIGWLVVALAPLNIASETVGTFLFTKWIEPSRVNIEITVGDGDVFALVFGLLLVIVGHVMFTAIEISEENKAFV